MVTFSYNATMLAKAAYELRYLIADRETTTSPRCDQPACHGQPPQILQLS